MDNGHGITTTTSNNNNVKGNANADTDAKSTSDVESMEDTVEFRLMMAYAQRRRPRGDRDLASPQTPAEAESEVNVKKAGGKKKNILRFFFKCVKPQREEEEDACEEGDEIATSGFRSFPGEDDEAKNRELEEVASRLTKLADEVQLTTSDIESDGEEDDVEKVIGLLLKDAGDRFNEEVLKNASLSRELFGEYSFFERLMSAYLRKMGFSTFEPEGLGPQGSAKVQIALTCEVTSRLSAVDTLPMSRVLGCGAKYLQDHYSAWATQQGGYEVAVDEDEDEEEVQ